MVTHFTLEFALNWCPVAKFIVLDWGDKVVSGL
jgi:hypothetical protein